jgi:ACS family glucarate transporter-like MFS transporter
MSHRRRQGLVYRLWHGVATRQRFMALTLLCMALAVAVGERSALSIAAPSLQSDLGLSTIEIGWLLSAFAWSYVAAHIPVGLIVEKYGTRTTIGLGIAFGAVTSLIITASGFSLLASSALIVILAARVALGIAQAPVGSSSGIVMSAWFPRTERGVAGAVFSSIPYLAVALLNPLLGYLTEHHGWRAMFLGMALISLGAAWVWFSKFSLPSHATRLRAKERRKMLAGGALIGLTHTKAAPSSAPPNQSVLSDFKAVFLNRMMGGTVIAQYCINAITWFFLAWFPTYLVMTFGYTIAKAAAVSAIPAIAGFIGGFGCGILSDAILKRTHDLTKARKIPIYLGIGLSSLSFLACIITTNDTLAIVLMTTAFFGKGLGTLGWTLVADLAPANKVGFTGSVVNGVGNLSGIFTPVIVGYLIAASQNFHLALFIMAMHGFVAIATHIWMTGKLQRLAPIH